jgi:Leucine-rich repeat (LRR) protein
LAALPVALGPFPSLTCLDLSHNRLRDTAFRPLAGLPQLLQLQMAHNKILTMPNDLAVKSSSSGSSSKAARSQTCCHCCCDSTNDSDVARSLQQEREKELQPAAAAAAKVAAGAASTAPAAGVAGAPGEIRCQDLCKHCRKVCETVGRADASSNSSSSSGSEWFARLQVLDLGGNALKEVGDVVGALGLPMMEQLWLGETPLAAHGKKRQAVWRVSASAC